MKKAVRIIKGAFLIAVLLTGSEVSAQHVYSCNGSAFITNEKQSENVIFIPNWENYFLFKVYKKSKGDADYKLTATINRPAPYTFSKKIPYSIEWKDSTTRTENIDYKIEAYNRAGAKQCDLKVIKQAVK